MRKFKLSEDDILDIVRYVLVIVLFIIIVSMMFNSALACTADVGTANTSVYVRDISTGDIVGSLKKGDNVVVTGKIKYGWLKVNIGEKDYKIFGEYLDVNERCLDEVKIVGKPRKSKSASKKKSVYDKSKHRISGSIFDGVEFW